MGKKVGRNSKELTNEIKEEADEILQLAFKNVGFVKKKLTYNSVVKFNQHIANNPSYIRKNGAYYNDLGVRFWSKSYNNIPYHGKFLIDKLKKVDKDDIPLYGEVFEINNKDIELLVDRYNNKPTELKQRLINLFSKDRKQIADLKFRNLNLEKKLNQKKKELDLFEEGFATLFWNSTSTYNSLEDILSIEAKNNEDGKTYPENGKVYKELVNMFDGDKERIREVYTKYNDKENVVNNDIYVENTTTQDTVSKPNNVFNMTDKLNSMGLTSAEDEGW